MSQMQQRAVKVAMYSPDSIGLGHVRRLSAIAEELTRERGNVTTLIMAGCAAGPYFPLPEGADFIKLPSLEKIGSSEWKPRSLQIPQPAMRNLRAGLVREAIVAFEPDILLVDHNPAGLDNELVPALEAIRDAGLQCEVVLGIRDILGAPADIRKQWQASDVYGLLDEHYDRILVYGSQDLFPAADLYGMDGKLAERVSYCGYVYQQGRTAGAAPAGPRPFEDDSRAKLLVTAGGGHDAHEMMAHVLQSLPFLPGSQPADVLMVAGPLMPEGDYARLVEMCRGMPVRLERSRADLVHCIEQADLIITMGGYNTLMEAIGLNKRTIVIPRTGPSAEQMIRARLFDQLGLITAHLHRESSPAGLARLIGAKLDEPESAGLSLQFPGLRTAARTLLHGEGQVRDAVAATGAQPGQQHNLQRAAS